MKNRVFYTFIILIVLGCNVETRNELVDSYITISDVSRVFISGLDTPTVSYTLTKDGEEYLNAVDIPLVESGGTYAINLSLLTGAEYKFLDFTISSNNQLTYILDEGDINNSTGFSISTDGVFSSTPCVYLNRVTDIVFEGLEYETFSVEISTDETSVLDPVDLTFQVSSNIPDATFKIYKYTIYWVSGPTLAQNDIFDMDTGNLFNPLEVGDDEAWGSGKFKIETTNSSGEMVFVVGFTEEWSKKHIHLILD
ncbi:hypothetical protein EW093_00365 [Thiospirochaeta perfilievii]|uniref:Uncharacterized protein n=1 Tax=Thiospirochaeta perfilievii TaxID=252967 RepID=A0A5C1Q780_9SPIO|nr:hypothetical protein [Thiospirochaeta perfilievii]QEN03218.1 hypothetical protein EW093_00365 [Thiospirochaeta perfilievii]